MSSLPCRVVPTYMYIGYVTHPAIRHSIIIVMAGDNLKLFTSTHQLYFGLPIHHSYTKTNLRDLAAGSLHSHGHGLALKLQNLSVDILIGYFCMYVTSVCMISIQHGPMSCSRINDNKHINMKYSHSNNSTLEVKSYY